MGSLSILQGIFPTRWSNPGLLHCRQILYQLSHKGSPRILEWVAYPFSRDLPNPGIKPGSPALQADSLPTELCTYRLLVIFFNWNIIALQHYVSFSYTTKWISYIYKYTHTHTHTHTHIHTPPPSWIFLPLLHPTPRVHHRALSQPLCAVWRFPTSYLFCTWLCIYINPLWVCPTLPFPHCVSISVL